MRLPINKLASSKVKILNVFLICALFLTSFGYFSLGYRFFNLREYHCDEGAIAYGSALILNGGQLYRDFEIHEFPGQYYLLAAVFKIFGENIEVQRLFALLILGLLICCVYIIIQKVSSRINAFLAALFSLSWLKLHMVYARPVQTATLFSILSCLFIINFIYSKTSAKKWLVIAGILNAITILFRQDFGFYTFVAIFSVIFFSQLELGDASNNWKKNARFIIEKELYFLLSICAVIIPACIYFIKNSTFKELIFDTIILPWTVLNKEHVYAFPDLKWSNLLFYLPLFVFFVTSIKVMIDKFIIRPKDKRKTLVLLLFLLLGIGLFNYYRYYSSISHFLYSMIPAIMLLIILYDDFLKVIERRAGFVYGGLIKAIVFIFAFSLLFYSIRPVILSGNFSVKNCGRLDSPRAKGFFDSSEMAQSQGCAIKYIQENTSPQEKIFVGNTRHDRVFTGDNMFYFLSERFSPTKYCNLDIGTGKKEIQNEIIKDIKENNVRYIVLCSVFDDIDSSLNIGSRGISDLDDFIKKNYIIEKIFGPYIILKHI